MATAPMATAPKAPNMEQHPHPSARAVFDHALEIESAAHRQAYLAEACAGDAGLRQKVDGLLNAYEDAGSFLESPPHGWGAGATLGQLPRPPTEGVGSKVGPYKLLQLVGEGGMGVVFLAEQQHPVRRQVALKVIKAGMDSRQVVARFEAERQALALMDHPNIAKVLDAGTTDAGRPYFVMELVKGIPITKYCDEHHIEPRQRLELFVQVCQAVQHAHQKGIIHRDLKPSNVLVALYDGKPVPKVIDFGVAKATGQQLTDLTMFTGFGDVIGTLEYMSPEQAEVNQLDVDTRSDIYSLGVLLYELLTGSTPLEHKRVMKAGLLEMLRVIREEEPPRPSTRLTTEEHLPGIAANRGLEPKKLGSLVKGELDWIAMKSLEKDRNRRYETAAGFAADVRRYLADEAVQACPPSGAYRFKKFVRRHKVGVSAGSAVAAALLAGLVAASIGFLEARRQTRIARTQVVIGNRGYALMMNAEARGNSADAQRLARETLAMANELFGDEHPEVAQSRHVLSMCIGKSEPEEAISLERQAVAFYRKYPVEPGRHHVNLLAFSLDNLGGILMRRGDVAEPERIYRESLPLFRDSLGNDHAYVANTLDHLGTVLAKQAKHAEAENCFRECLAIRRRVSGEQHYYTTKARSSLIDVLKSQGKGAEAEHVRREAADSQMIAATNPTTNPQSKRSEVE
jgi:serine/threonine protein kinase